jgi:hypothetical protein
MAYIPQSIEILTFSLVITIPILITPKEVLNTVEITQGDCCPRAADRLLPAVAGGGGWCGTPEMPRSSGEESAEVFPLEQLRKKGNISAIQPS